MSTAPVVKIAGTGAAAATFTTASYTPEANSRELAYVSSFKSTAGVALPTISDTAGNVWTQLASFETTTAANPNIRGVWFISDDTGGSPAARTVTVASTGAASMGVIIADVLSVDVSGSLAQAAVGGEDLANGDPSMTFGSTPGATNITLLGASFGGGNTGTKPASFTSLADAVNSTARRNSASYDITSASIGPNQYTSTNVRSLILGIELAPAGSANKTLVAAAGSYSLSGTAASLKLGRVVAAAAGSYALSGSAATLRRALPLVAGAGSYSLTGVTAGLLHGWKVAAGAGSYSISGTAATLRAGKAVAAAAGSYSITGSDAALTKSATALVLAAGAGSYSLSGSTASLLLKRSLVAGSGAYALSGSAASLLLKRMVAASTGAYAMTGASANLTASGSPSPPAAEHRQSGQMVAMGRMMSR